VCLQRASSYMLWHRFGEHAQCSFFEILIVWLGTMLPVFLVERSELNPGRIIIQHTDTESPPLARRAPGAGAGRDS